MVFSHPPGNKVPADIKEDKEALVVRREGSVSTQAPSLLPQALQIDHMQVYLLCNRRRRHWVGDHTPGWPSPAIHIKVPINERKGVKFRVTMVCEMNETSVLLFIGARKPKLTESTSNQA